LHRFIRSRAARDANRPAGLGDSFLAKCASPASDGGRADAPAAPISYRVESADRRRATASRLLPLTLSLCDFEIYLSVGEPAPRAQYHPHQPPVGHFFLAIFAAPATAGARAIAPPS